MKKILLVGNPNVGKSVIFSRLTGVDVISSNYPGTTIEFTMGNLKAGEERCQIIDVPGIYSLEATSKAEEVAVEMLEGGDVIIDILDSTNLERNLNLTLMLIKKKIPMMVILNFWDEIKHIGISIDGTRLEEILGVPVMPVCAVTGEGIKNAVSRIREAKVSAYDFTDKNRWKAIGEIIEKTQKVEHKHHTLLERLSDITVRPLTGIPAAATIMYLVFEAVRLLGEGIINRLMDPFFNNVYMPVVLKVAGMTGAGFIREFLVGKTPEVMKSFGILTTGLYIPFVVVLPYILSFYLVLSFLEDFGYLPRLAVLLDNIFHKLGLHGYSSIPVILGLGCKVPAILSVRILETQREKIIATVLLLMSAPCMPQTAMILSLGMRYGIKTAASIFAILIVVSVASCMVLNRIMKGETPELFVEIPPYRLPKLTVILKKLWLRIKGFLMEAVPIIILGVGIVNVFDLLGIMGYFTKLMQAPFARLFGLPGELASVALLGFLRKDMSIALLAPFSLTSAQFVKAGVFLALYLPCLATFFTMAREMGWMSAVKITVWMLAATSLVMVILNVVL